jgi:Rieske Fe-S protein
MIQRIVRDTSRRRFLVLCGGSACAVTLLPGVLTGCSGGEPTGEETPEGDWLTVALADYPDLEPVGGMVLVEVTGEDLTLAVVRLPEGFAALDGTCTHQGCLVSSFDLDTSELVCGCHNSTFDLSGDPTGGPATEPVAVFETEYDEDAGEVRIHLSD